MSPIGPTNPPTFDHEWAQPVEQGPSSRPTPSSSSSNGNEGGLSPVTSEYGTNSSGITIYPVEKPVNVQGLSVPMVPGSVTASVSTAVPTMAVGKRRRDEPHGDGGPVELDSHEMLHKKRVRANKATGILTAQSTTRTRHKRAARIPETKINHEPKEAGRIVERLASPNSQGIHCRSLPGPRFPQGWAEEDPDGRLIWVEASVEEKVVQQQQQEQKDKLFKIPQEFETRCRTFLMVTQADWARGTVKEIRCKFCPKARLKTWDAFERHRKTAEGHPSQLHFCDNCGDFFARIDSLNRHHKSPPDQYLRATPENAEAKHRSSQNLHDEFMAEMERGENIGMPFWQRVRYSNSAKKQKKGGRGQS